MYIKKLITILCLFLFSCQSERNLNNETDSVTDIKEDSVTIIPIDSTEVKKKIEVDFSISKIKSDADFNKYAEVSITNNTNKTVVALSFLIYNDYCSFKSREKIEVKPNSSSSFKLYIIDKCVKPETLLFFLREVIYSDGEIYNSLGGKGVEQ